MRVMSAPPPQLAPPGRRVSLQASARRAPTPAQAPPAGIRGMRGWGAGRAGRVRADSCPGAPGARGQGPLRLRPRGGVQGWGARPSPSRCRGNGARPGTEGRRTRLLLSPAGLPVGTFTCLMVLALGALPPIPHTHSPPGSQNKSCEPSGQAHPLGE